MKTAVLLGAGSLLLVAGAVPIVLLHRSNAQLQSQLNDRRLVREDRTANSSLGGSAITGEQGRSAPVASEVSARLAHLRTEVAVAETKAADQYAATTGAIEETSTNRDPEKGMTRLEYLQNVGQDTPAAALQTLFWATLKGQEEVMARTIGWDPAVRPQAQALIDALPEALRARFSTPEQLAGLFISKYALDVSAIHIAATTRTGAASASLTVEGLTLEAQHLPMRLGPNGWQLWAEGPTLKALRKDLLGRK